MQHEEILISIIMPVYNAENYLHRALENLSQQQFDSYEILLIDGISTDSTAVIAHRMMKINNKIKWFSESDKGIYDAMNKGIALAKGQWIYFIGCDDAFCDVDVLKRITEYLVKGVDIVYGDVRWVPGGELEAGVCKPYDLYRRNINHQRIFYRSSLFEKYGNYNLKYKIASDYELNIRFFCNDEISKLYVPITIAYYHSGGFSADKVDDAFWHDWKKVFRSYFYKHLPTKYMYEKLGWYCRNLIDRKLYIKALLIFSDVFFHTLSLGFVWLTSKHLIQSLKKHAS